MKNILIVALQCALILIGLGALTFMIGEPQFEGRNANATTFQIYFNDPFLAYAYLSSIPFYFALYQTFKLLGYIKQNELFSANSLKAMQTIKYCAMALIALVLAPLAYLFIVRPEDDIAGGVAMGVLMLLVFIIVAIISAKFEKKLQNGINKL